MLGSRMSWLDHDSEARERNMRVLAMLGERDRRDELGLGSIREDLAELLFPGTSTIQTRLRYMFFVPWVYQEVESELARGALGSDRVSALAAKCGAGYWRARAFGLGCRGGSVDVPLCARGSHRFRAGIRSRTLVDL